jgi:hypothetical protein
MVVDEFRFELDLHHPSCDPHEITEQLSLKPWFAVKHGTHIGDVLHKKTTWLCRFRGGSTNSEFTQALEDTVSLFSEHQAFISRFIEQGGEVELVLNSATDSSFASGDKLFELRLHPWFLSRLAENDIHLRLQVWIAESRTTPG